MRTRHSISLALVVSALCFSLASAKYAATESVLAPDSSQHREEVRSAPPNSNNFQIHAGWQPLFNGRDLGGWYTFLQKHGRNSDPDHLISIDDGVIHLYRDSVDGTQVVQGYIATEKEFGNYHLRLQYRWGKKKFEPRAAKPRDAGVYYHMVGKDAVWPVGLQCQIQEGNTGDLLALYGLQLDSWVNPATKEDQFRTFQDEKRGGVPVVLGGKAIAYQTRSIMNEVPGWNTLEIIAREDSVTHILNGKIVNRGAHVRKVDSADPAHSVPITKGRIALEIEAAEVEYRNIEIKQLDAEKSASALPTEKATEKELSHLRVGASAVNLRSDKSMVIAGGIEPHYAADQEGELRAVAIVIEQPGQAKVAIVACDVVFVPGDLASAAVTEIEKSTNIPADHVLINATHTHHAPSTVAIHGYGDVREFRDELRRGIVRAVEEANSRLEGGESTLYFHLNNEDTIGSNSRQLLPDGSITWTAQQEPSDKARPTAPFDPQLPVLDFRDSAGKSRAILFNHSTHTIGTRSGHDTRSPGFYGLAAQDLEKELGGVVSFLEGASGSTHNVAPRVPVTECIERLKADVRESRAQAQPQQINSLAAVRRPFKFRVRHFNEAEEDAKVSTYLKRYLPTVVDRFGEVFSNMRRQLRDRQGAEQHTWIQAIAIGDVVIVGIPAEYFTVLGINIKQRSPFEHTYIAELANDWIGYLPDREGHRLGGYQTWTGLHSYAEEGTGERMADEVVQMLHDLAGSEDQKSTSPSSTSNERRTPDHVKPASADPRSPASEQSSFKLADPNLQIELVASEPDIVSPVAIAWDADGRMYVSEMTGYPTTKRMGRIRRLEDRDGDGRYEPAITFCDGLNFPTSVMPYRNGILVTDAPDILYLEDTDGDGRADVRRVEWTGFGTAGSEQLRANSLHWGLDNWIYVANGRCDGRVRRPDSPADQTISIRARDYRFNPITKQGEAILGQSQFGQAHDAWGNRFLSWNTIPIRQVLLEETDIKGYPEAAAEAVTNISDANDTGRVYPIATAPKQFNAEQANYYNALCGLTIFSGNSLGENYSGNAFVCESLTSLVTRRILTPAGAAFVASRNPSEVDREFLAAADNWFHPVNLTTGPDGALYVVDFYREFVEHPEYVADKKIRAEMSWRNGAEYGRIWRVRSRNAGKLAKKDRPSLSSANSAQLVEVLDHPIAWWRTTAQRLLVERQDRTVIPSLRALLTNSPSALGRLHALYVLDGLDTPASSSTEASIDRHSRALDNPSLLHALQDSNANVRKHAVRLIASRVELSGGSTTLRDALSKMVDDPDPAVRFQLALALGPLDTPTALAKLMNSDDSSALQLAVLCGVAQRPWLLVQELLSNKEGGRGNAKFLEQLAEQHAQKAGAKDLANSLAWLSANVGKSPQSNELATMAGISRGLFAQGRSLSNPNLPHLPKDITDALREQTSAAMLLAKDSSLPVEDRVRAIIIAAGSTQPAIDELVRQLVQPSQPQVVQSSALWVAAQGNRPETWQELFHRWPEHIITTRGEMLVQAMRSPAATEALIAALEADDLSAQELPAGIRDVLSQLHDESLRRRVQPLLASVLPADRAQVLAHYADLGNRRGDAARGATIFKQNCQTCHAIHGNGQKVGPDLTSVSSRRTDLLIADILDPSRQVSPDFINYLVVTKDGRTFTGVIAAETSEGVTLRREGGQQDTIPRSNIEQLRASGKSIMPDGLEQKLTRDQLVDLLEFLHNPDVRLLN